MKLGIGLVIGGVFWIGFDLVGGMNLFINPFSVSPDVRFAYHITALVLSIAMIVWGSLRIKRRRNERRRTSH